MPDEGKTTNQDRLENYQVDENIGLWFDVASVLVSAKGACGGESDRVHEPDLSFASAEMFVLSSFLFSHQLFSPFHEGVEGMLCTHKPRHQR